MTIGSKQDPPVFSLFEQYGRDEYIERSVEPLQEERMFAFEALELGGGRNIDLTYLSRQSPQSPVSIAVAFGDPQYVFRKYESSIPVGDMNPERAFLAGSRSTPGQTPDLIGYYESRERGGKLFRIAATYEGKISLVTESIHPLNIRSANDIKFINFSHNKYPDVVYYNTLGSSIELLRSDSTGKWSEPEPIATGKAITAFIMLRGWTGNPVLASTGKDESFIILKKIFSSPE